MSGVGDSNSLSNERPASYRGLLVILACAILWRLPYITHPICDIDEACYAAFAVGVMDGGVEYVDVADLKFPAIYWTYAAVFEVAGRYNMHAVHALATLFALATAAVLYLFALRTVGPTAAWWTAFLYASLVTFFPQNLAANCELFMNLPYAGCAYALWRVGLGRNAIAWSAAAGALAGCAILYKQIAAAVVATAGIQFALLWYVRRLSTAKLFGAGGAFAFGLAAPLAAVAGYFQARGAFDAFWFWTIDYLRWYIAASGVHQSYLIGVAVVFLPFVLAYGAAWVPAFSGLRRAVIDAVRIFRTRSATEEQSAFVLTAIWLVLSIAAPLSSPRMYPHYWIQYLPPLSLLAGLSIATLADRSTWYGRFIAPTGSPLYRRPLFLGTLAACAISWTYSWFYIGETGPAPPYNSVDFRPAVDYLRTHTRPGERAFVWGWFPPLYVHADLTPGTRFVNTQMFVNFAKDSAPREAPGWIPDAARTWIEHPQAWNMLEEDFAKRPPDLILDTSPGNHHRFGRFPMREFPRLQRLVDAGYRLEITVGGVGIYRRVAPVAGTATSGATR